MSYSWTSLSDEELLKLRFCDLSLVIEESELAGPIQELSQELSARNLRFQPAMYLSDEWQSPTGVVAIAIPFYLADPRLKALEQNLMMEVEGGDPTYCLKLLRHEAGHCFDHAFGFSRRPKWREIFGSPDQDYTPDTYRPRPYSRSFVRNLDNWYAQAHPDEDFAETFAVWLDPQSKWQETYRRWPVALAKLRYVDELARRVAGKEVKYATTPQYYSASRMKKTLGAHYDRRRKGNAESYPDFYDRDLIFIFSGGTEFSKREFGAAQFMKRNRKQLQGTLGRWTGETKYIIHSLLKKLTQRCEVLDLRTRGNEAETSREVAAYLSALVTNHLLTGKFKRSV